MNEYPKALYKGGQAYDPETGRGVAHQNMLLVNDGAEEEAARADGFADAAAPDVVEADEPEHVEGDETTEAPAGDDTLGGGAAADILAEDPNTAAVADVAEPEHPADGASV